MYRHVLYGSTEWNECLTDYNRAFIMFLALTTFEGLCGFRPYDEVCTYFETIPELKTVVGLEESSSFISACKGG